MAVKFGRKMTVGDIQRYARLQQSNPSFQSDYSELVDLTQIEELGLQADEIDPFASKAKRAFVVRNSTQRHAARMHKVQRTQRNIEIFESIEEGERWITT